MNLNIIFLQSKVRNNVMQTMGGSEGANSCFQLCFIVRIIFRPYKWAGIVLIR